MRSLLVLTISLAALGGAATAQTLSEIRARNSAAHALEDARRDLLASQIEASNARERARTETLLRDLGQPRLGVASRPPSLSVPLASVPPAGVLEDPAQRETELSNAMTRIDQLTQSALADSNAHMRAIRPASEPKR